MNAEPFVAVGRIVKTHGLNGEVSVAAATGASLTALVGVTAWFTPPPAGIRSAVIEAVRQGPKGPLVTFSGIHSADTARLIAGTEVLVARAVVPDDWLVEADEADELIGYALIDSRRGPIGEIVDTIVTGANDVWVVEGPFGEVLVPVIDDVVELVDDDDHTVRVTLLEGLLPGEGEEA